LSERINERASCGYEARKEILRGPDFPALGIVQALTNSLLGMGTSGDVQ